MNRSSGASAPHGRAHEVGLWDTVGESFFFADDDEQNMGH